MEKLTSISNKIKSSIEVIKILENWHLFFLDHLNLIREREIIYRTRRGIKIITRTNSLDRWMIKEVFGEKPYFRIKINEGDTVVDIGAHIGCYSLLASFELKGKGKIYAYEPDPDNYSLLVRNININYPYSSVIKAYNKAIGGYRRRVKLYRYIEGGKIVSYKTSIHLPKFNESLVNRIYKPIEVEVITLRDIFDDNDLDRINVLKVDCEGMEYEILFNTPEDILKRIDRICLEYHDLLTDPYSHEDLLTFLSKVGFMVQHYIPPKSAPGCGIIYAWNLKGNN